MLTGKYTPQVQEAITRLGGRMTYSEAQEEMALMWNVRVSNGGARHITLRHGRVADKLIDRQIERLEQESPKPEATPEHLVLSVDGAMVALTNGEYREVRTMALGDLTTRWDAKEREIVAQTANISYFSRLEPAAQFERSALYEWHQRGGENARKVVTINDGALWIQSFIDSHCPKAERILDWSHAQTYLAQIGKSVFQPESIAFKKWYTVLSKQLLTKPPQHTLGDLHLLLRQQQNHPDIELMQVAVRYLEKRRDMIDYPRFKRIPLPIGSGIVESGHKVVMQRRMKQAGMRWAEANVNPMLALRTALCNRRWHAAWQAIQGHALQSRYSAKERAVQPVSTNIKTDTITQTDCHRLEKLARRIERKRQSSKPWNNHDWIFPHRRGRGAIHQN